jgi:hypothetical protein
MSNDPSDPSEWVKIPASKPHITKIFKLKSDTLGSLNYSLAGLTNCIPDPAFVLDTPLVTDLFGTFHSFGRNVDLDDPDGWMFNPGLLSQITLVTQMNNTFRNCRMRAIPSGFLDNQVNVVSLFETFKKAYLGVGYYEGWTQDEFLQRNLSGTSFIPMSLLWKMPLLHSLYATFNALQITDRNYGNLQPGTFGNWHNLSLLIRAEFFRNGKDAGNESGTLTDISYCFGKINQLSVENDLFRYVRNTLQNISAVFYQSNWPRSKSVTQSVFFDGGGTPGSQWRDVVTMNVQDLLGSQQFPAVTLALNAFSASYSNFGFNGIFSNDPTIAPDSVSIDNTICPHFPAISRNAGQWDSWSYQTGLDGMLYNLRLITEEVTPDADLTQATTTNPVQY